MEVLQPNAEVQLHTASFGPEDNVEVEGAPGWQIPAEAYPVLYKLAQKWKGITGCRNLRLKPLKGAMTNQVFQCTWTPAVEGEKSRKVLVRVYGESSALFFNRDDEMLTFEKMSHHGQGPRLLARFPNGRVEEFLHARTLTAEDLRNPEIAEQIAIKLKQFHALDMPGVPEPTLWKRLSLWSQKALELCGSDIHEEFRLQAMKAEIEELEKRIRHPGEVIGFCHNDLQYGNIMLDENDQALTIIDYEYASFNPVAYDIANHFCEMAANYHTDTPHVLDYAKYPDRIERLRFVRAYVHASMSGSPGDELEVDSLMKDVDSYVLASHLLWGLWGLISATSSEIEYDYLEYARQRFSEYHSAKGALLKE